MLSWKRILVPAAAAFGLLACNQPDPSAVPPESASGSARVALPELPSGYLAGYAQAILYLDVTGPGMAPIRIAAPLAEGKAGSVDVKGIPPGKPRVFHGLLVRIDGSKKDSTVTHEGSDTTGIQAGVVTEVHLFLKANGLGGAHVCLDVEGWPSNPACGKPPIPQPGFPKVDSLACWAVEQRTTDGRTMKGSLWVAWRGAALQGLFQWDWNGASFTVDNGNVPIGGGALYLFGILPGGFGHPPVSAIERAHYKAKIYAGALNTGAAYAKAGPGDWTAEDRFSDWSGKASTCPDKAKETLARQFK